MALALLLAFNGSVAGQPIGGNQPYQPFGTCSQYQPGAGGDYCLNNGSVSYWQQFSGDVINDTRNTPQCSATNISKCGHLEVKGLQNVPLNGTPTNGQTWCYNSTNNDYEPCPGSGGTFVSSVTGGTGINITGTATAPVVNLTTPVSIANGGTGTATPALVAGTGITISGTWPDQTIASSGGGGSSSTTITVANAATTGTTLNALAKFTGAPSTAVITATTDTGGAIGIVTAGAGTTGNATIQINGLVDCIFDGATTAGDYVNISSTTAGDCHDDGSSYPTSGEIIGRVLSTNASGGTYQLDEFPPELRGGSGSSGLVTHSVSATTSAPSLTCSSNAEQDYYYQTPSISSVTPNLGAGCTVGQTIFYFVTQGSSSTAIGNFTAGAGTISYDTAGGNQLVLGTTSGDTVLYQIKYDGTNWHVVGQVTDPAQAASLSVAGSSGALQTNNGSSALGAYAGSLCSSGVVYGLTAAGAADCSLTGTFSVTPPSSVGCADTSETITGAATTMGCNAAPAGTLAAADENTTWGCYVSAANTVQIHLCAIAAITAAAQSYNVRLIP